MIMAEAEKYLRSLQTEGMKLGLARMERAAALCGHPERRLRFVHVAGTNGKGSVSRMIQAMLTEAGYRTGLYSSPPVTGLRDTITIDGQPIPDAAFARLTDRLKKIQPEMGEAGMLSEFELTTMLAFLYFCEQNADICVIECGLGGRDDATNCIPSPLAAVLTSVSLDHTAVLGQTTAEIARVKCGILKAPCAVITSPDQDDDALAVLFECAAGQELTVRIPLRSGVILHEDALGRLRFSYDGMNFSLSLTGQFQVDNALTALEAVRSLETYGFMISKLQKERGLGGVKMPCRQEVVSREPLRMLDGGHNPQGIAALADTLKRYKINGVTLLTGMLADKDVETCVRILTPYCRKVYCCTVDNTRAMDGERLAALWKKLSPACEVYACDTPWKAWNLLRKNAAFEIDPIVVAGSFYLSSVVRPWIREAL